MFATPILTAAVALAVWTAGAGPQVLTAQNARDNGSADVRVAFAPLYDTHDRLAARFRDLWGAATASGATVKQRQEFVRFLKDEVETFLHLEGITVYPVFDSLTTSGYATPAALFDRGAIARVVNEIADSGAALGQSEFKAKSYAVAVLLESYFTKTEFLVLPVVHKQLGESGIRALLARL